MEAFSTSRLIELLEKNNISQRELAAKVGVQEATISRYINGLRAPHSVIIAKIAEVLETTTDYLLGRSDSPDPPSNPREIIAPHREGDQFADLPPEAIAEIQMHIDYVRHKYKKQQPDDKK
jgi:transcriptional regulator with XRE-family HTH domain